MSNDTNTETQNSPSKGVRVKWEDKKTESDIQIVGGPTTITRYGTVSGHLLMPVPNKPGQMMLMAIVAGDDKQWHVMPLEAAVIV